MRILWTIMAVLVIGAAVPAGEDAIRVPLLKGVYSVESPAEWWLEEEEDGSAATFAPQENSPNQIIFSAPNTRVQGDYTEYVELQMRMIFLMLDGGEVTSERDDTFEGRPCRLFDFTVPFGPGAIMGTGMAVNYEEGVATMLALAPEDLAEEFLPRAAAIMKSYRLDAAALAENRTAVDELSERINGQLEEVKAILEE